MTAEELVDAYVSDVAKLLPRKQRGDVAMELRALLHEELAAKDRESAALELLRAFGRPADVAARYGQPLTVIDQADTRRFARLSVIGVAVIWLLGALGSSTVVEWWQTYGLPALWWPGFLVVCFAGAAWVRRRWPNTARWKPRPSAAGYVNRPGRVAALIFFVIGTVVLINAPKLFAVALSYDADFLRLRGPLVLAMLVLGMALYLAVTVQGRWSPLTRNLEAGFNVALCGILIWVLVAGPIFQSPPADRTVKFAIILIVAATLIDLAVKARRQSARRTLNGSRGASPA